MALRMQMTRAGVDRQLAWRALSDHAASLTRQPTPTVFTTELKRLIAAGASVALRLGVAPALDASRLASALWWV